MTTFVALYRGETVATSKMVAITSESSLVREVAEKLLLSPDADSKDPVIQEIEQGRRRALQLIQCEEQ